MTIEVVLVDWRRSLSEFVYAEVGTARFFTEQDGYRLVISRAG